MGSQPTSVCVCVDGRSHTKHAMCVSEVRRGICESVAGVAWRVRGERGHMGRQRGWWVWWPRRSLTHTHSSVGGTTVGGCAWCHHSHTHTADRAGQRTQWWWLVGKAHSGGGSHTTHTATTTTCPSPRVCVNREWTAPAQPVSGPSGHTRHNTHAATTTSTTTTSSSSKRRSGVVWGTRSGWTCEWRARRGHSQHRGHTHTHQAPKCTSHHACVCVCGVVVWLGCVRV